MDAAVIVVGAGPAGLMLTGELRLAGVDVMTIDSLAEPTGESRGLGFTARTMEVFNQRGLLPRFGELETSATGHFGGIPVDFSLLEGAHAGVKGVPQSRTEAMLGDWVTSVGGYVRRGWELSSVADRGSWVELEVRTPDGTRTLSASYVVGCDGGRSAVRKLGGFDFPGTEATLEMFLADVEGADLRPRPIGETGAGGMVMAGPLGDGVDRIIVCERGTPPARRTEPVQPDEIASAWHRLTGEDISHATFRWVSSFGDAARLVTEYRRGHVLLAGDAAHIQLPAGGQGMNTSIQDSVNLGWKLAAQINGWAPPSLLDTYHHERHPVGKRLLTNTRAQGMLILGGDEVQPMRDVLTELVAIGEVSRHLAGMVSGLDIRYDVGPVDDSLAGTRLPEIDLVTDTGRGTSITELLHTGRGLLLFFGNDDPLAETAEPWSDRVDIVVATPHGIAVDSPLAGTDALLVRPDGHVAWTSPGGGKLEPALSRWFGSRP